MPYHIKYNECCDLCVCTGVVLLNGVAHAAKTKVPHLNWCIHIAFGGQASNRRHQ